MSKARVYLSTLLGVAAAVLPSSALAGGLVNTKVTLIVTSVNIAYVTSSADGTGRPACATMPTQWVFDNTTARGQNYLSLALTAQATNRNITISGNGTCDAAGREYIQYIALYDYQ